MELSQACITSCSFHLWLEIGGLLKIQSHSFINDAARVWNEAPRQIKDSMTLSSAKKHIKSYVQTLPI